MPACPMNFVVHAGDRVPQFFRQIHQAPVVMMKVIRGLLQYSFVDLSAHESLPGHKQAV